MVLPRFSSPHLLGKGVYLIYRADFLLSRRHYIDGNDSSVPWLTDVLIGQMSCVGSVLIFAISLNLIFNSKAARWQSAACDLPAGAVFFLAQFFPDSRHLIKSTQFDFLFALPYNGYNI